MQGLAQPLHAAALETCANTAKAAKLFFNNPWNPWAYTTLAAHVNATLSLAELVENVYGTRQNIFDKITTFDGETVPVTRELIGATPFMNIWCYTPQTELNPEAVVVTPPYSGQQESLAEGYYLTAFAARRAVIGIEYIDPQNIPVEHGPFTPEEQARGFDLAMDLAGEAFHLVTMCESGTVAFEVRGHREKQEKPAPLSTTVAACPIDPSESPSFLSTFVENSALSDIKKLFITVPPGYAGEGRLIFPGVLAYTRCVSLGATSNGQKLIDLYNAHVEGNQQEIETLTRHFTHHIGPSFNLDAAHAVTCFKRFKEQTFAKGNAILWDIPVTGEDITGNIYVITGEKDKTVPSPQTTVLEKICPNAKVTVHTIEDAGHFDCFVGPKFEKKVAPILCGIWQENSKDTTSPTASIVPFRRGPAATEQADDFPVQKYG